MSICSAIQQRLAEQGAAAVEQDADLGRHVAGCTDCTRFLEDLSRVEFAARQLPLLDPPDWLVADTLRAVRRAKLGDHGNDPASTGRRRLAGALAACFVIAAAFGLAQDFASNPGAWGIYDQRVAGSPYLRDDYYDYAANAPMDRTSASRNILSAQKKTEAEKSTSVLAGRRFRRDPSRCNPPLP